MKASVGRNTAEALRLQSLNFHGVETEAFPVRVEPTNVEALASGAGLMVDCLDNLRGRTVLTAHARSQGAPLVHAAISADGTFGLIRWDQHFQPDEEDEEGRATCEGGRHLPFIGLVAGALAGVIRDFVDGDVQRDLMITPGGIAAT